MVLDGDFEGLREVLAEEGREASDGKPLGAVEEGDRLAFAADGGRDGVRSEGDGPFGG